MSSIKTGLLIQGTKTGGEPPPVVVIDYSLMVLSTTGNWLTPIRDVSAMYEVLLAENVSYVL